MTGIGHETDFTIADFVADLRAPTPTGAAAAVVPDRAELLAAVWELRQRLDRLALGQIQRRRADAVAAERSLRRASPLYQVRQWRQRVDEQLRRLSMLTGHYLEILRRETDSASSRLQMANPQAVLRRGYAIVQRRADGQLVRSTQDVKAGEVRVNGWTSSLDPCRKEDRRET